MKNKNLQKIFDFKKLKIKVKNLNNNQKNYLHLIDPRFFPKNLNPYRENKKREDYVYETPVNLEKDLFYLHPLMDPSVLEQGAVRRFPAGVNKNYISEKYFDDKWVSEGNNALKKLMEIHIKNNLEYYQKKKIIRLVDIGPCGGAITTLFALGALAKYNLLEKTKIAELDIVPNVLEATILGKFFVPNEIIREYSLEYAAENGKYYKKILKNGILHGVKEWYKDPQNKQTIFTEQALKLSKKNNKNNNHKVDYFRGDGEKIPARLKNYDFVLSAYTHHHMNIIGRKKLCEQMEKMAGKNGFIGIVDFYVKDYEKYMKWYKPHFIRYGDAPPVECPVIGPDILKNFFSKTKILIYTKPLRRSLLIYGIKK